jgi:hypothetical protein
MSRFDLPQAQRWFGIRLSAQPLILFSLRSCSARHGANEAAYASRGIELGTTSKSAASFLLTIARRDGRSSKGGQRPRKRTWEGSHVGPAEQRSAD